jgi:hypothetical protein
MSDSWIYYTYLWLRRDGTPYYAGKGKDRRGFTGKDHFVHCPSEHERIVIQHHPSENEALEAEKFLIAFYGRKDNGTGCLRNLTDGGEWGGYWTGKTLSAEHKEKDRLANLGEKNGFFGKQHTAETKAKIAKANSSWVHKKGYRHSLETKARMSLKRRVRKTSEETRRRMSEAHKRRWAQIREL